ncbi:hypothetical protein GXP67_04340 [Rhodocytophaga rosea]|uniref:HEAT repeat domain-containing protein n=1 Tax=Rhodocytophaga rosea TaxID=2704465 RepID=A0A6C0GDT0_9BACT|nr:hypothetical protein [Rhodocytophaga rosea]QHT65953.1 hypothetical protein GXP67_04340 [Rhodocytophaga rosea]
MSELEKFCQEYIQKGGYFAPDYDRDHEVLKKVKKTFPVINQKFEQQLIDLLKQETKKEFVGDLMYYYKNIPDLLINELLLVGINYGDPSFNRIFIRPSIKAEGTKKIIDKLCQFFQFSDKKTKIGISKLFYWIGPKNKKELDSIHTLVLRRIIEENDIIENYFYFHYFFKENDYLSVYNKELFLQAENLLKSIPDGSNSLEEIIKQDKVKLEFARNQLGWKIE